MATYIKGSLLRKVLRYRKVAGALVLETPARHTLAPVPATYTVATRALMRAITGYAEGETVRVTGEAHDDLFIYTSSGKATDGAIVFVPLDVLGSEQTISAPSGTTALGANVSWDDVTYRYGATGSDSFPAGKLHGSGFVTNGQGGLAVSAGEASFTYTTFGMPGVTESTVRLRRATTGMRLERLVPALLLADPRTGAVTSRTDYVRPEWFLHPDTGLPAPRYADGYADDGTVPAAGVDRLDLSQSAYHSLCWAERLAHARARAKAVTAGLADLPHLSAAHNVAVVLDGLYGYHNTMLRRPGVDWLPADNRTASSDRPGGSNYGTLGYEGVLVGGQPIRRIGVKVSRGAQYRFHAFRTATGGYAFSRQPEDWLLNEGAGYPVVGQCPGRGLSRTGAVEVDGGLFENEENMAGAEQPLLNPWREQSGPGGGSFNTAAYSAIRNSTYGDGVTGSVGPFDGIPGDVQRHDFFGTFVHSTLGTTVGGSNFTGFGGTLLRMRDSAGNHQNYQIHQAPGQTLDRVEVSGVCYAAVWEPYMGHYGEVVIRDVPETPYLWLSQYESVGGRRSEDVPVGDHLTVRASKPHHGRGYFEGHRQLDFTGMPQPGGGGVGGFVTGGDAPYVLDRLTMTTRLNYNDRMTSGYGGQPDSRVRIGKLGTSSVVGGKQRSLIRGGGDTHYRDVFVPDAYSQYEQVNFGIALDADSVISWYGGTIGDPFGDDFHGTCLIFPNDRTRLRPGGAGTRPSTIKMFFRDMGIGTDEVMVDLGGGDTVYPASEIAAGGTAVYCQRVDLRAAPTARNLAWSYYEQTTIKGGRTSEAAGTLTSAALTSGHVDVPVNLFAAPQAPSNVVVTGADAGRYTGWTNVGTDSAPVLRLAFSGAGAVSVSWSAAVRPLPPGLVWPLDEVVPAAGPVATGALPSIVTADGSAPTAVDLSALFAYDGQNMATTGEVRYALVEPHASAGLASVTGHTLTVDPTDRGDSDVEVWVRCQDMWGRFADLKAPLRVNLRPFTEYDSIEDATLAHPDLVAYWPATADHATVVAGSEYRTPNLVDAANPLVGTTNPVVSGAGRSYTPSAGTSVEALPVTVGALQGRSFAYGGRVHSIPEYSTAFESGTGGASTGLRRKAGQNAQTGAYNLRIDDFLADWDGGALDFLVVFEVLTGSSSEFGPSEGRVYINGTRVKTLTQASGGLPWAGSGESALFSMSGENAITVSHATVYASAYKAGGWLRDAEVAQMHAERVAAG